MASPDPVPTSAADAAFLARCREDLAGLLAATDEVVEVVRLPAAGEQVRLEARVVVGGLPGSFSAEGDTILEAYAGLRAAAPEERLALAFRSLLQPPAHS